MPRFEMKESRRQLTSCAGLSLIGQCFEVACAAPWLDGRLPVSGGMKTSDIVKSMVGLLSLGKNDFEAIAPFRKDRFFREALDISKVPSAEWLRQRLDKGGVKTYEVYGSHGSLLVEYTPSQANKLVEYIYLGGKRVAQREITPQLRRRTQK